MANYSYEGGVRLGGPIALGLLGAAVGATAGAFWSRTRHYRRVEAKTMAAGLYVKDRAQVLGRSVKDRAGDAADRLREKYQSSNVKGRVKSAAADLKERAGSVAGELKERGSDLTSNGRSDGRFLRGIMVALDALAVGTTVATIVRSARNRRGFKNLAETAEQVIR
ncbi:MAG TPA: hypothetical protein VGQ83_15805 [Polyangia bacterium]